MLPLLSVKACEDKLSHFSVSSHFHHPWQTSHRQRKWGRHRVYHLYSWVFLFDAVLRYILVEKYCAVFSPLYWFGSYCHKFICRLKSINLLSFALSLNNLPHKKKKNRSRRQNILTFCPQCATNTGSYTVFPWCNSLIRSWLCFCFFLSNFMKLPTVWKTLSNCFHKLTASVE